MNTPNEKMKPCFVMLEPVTPKMVVDFSTELRKVINERNILTTKTRRRVTEALEEIETENHEDIIKHKCEKLVNEIINSEKSYVNQLEVITEYFLKPAQEKKLLKPQDFEILFGNIYPICRINRELLDELCDNAVNVAAAFSKIAPFFKSYSTYALEFKRMLQILQNAHKDNPKFDKFLEMQESRPEVQSKLSALLIAPIQRIPRYKLLLSSLVRLNYNNDNQYDSLLDSLHKVEEAAAHINRVIKDQENSQRLLEFQRYLINGEPNIITPGRKLEKEGILMQILPRHSHSRKLYVVLMSDIIMFCKLKRDEVKVNSLKCTSIFPLNKCKVEDILDKGSFRIVCQDEDVVLYHDRLSTTQEWIIEIKQAIESYIEDRKTLKKESSARRPVKRKDMNEYHEVGVSPGKKLRRKRSPYEENPSPCKPLVTRRRPIRAGSPLNSASSVPNHEPSSIFITLKPKPVLELPLESEPEKLKESSKDVFVFGKDNPNRGFTFKVNQWFSGIGNSVKHFFGFKRANADHHYK